MAENTRDYNAEPVVGDDPRLRGGTQGGEQARQVDPNNSDGGTPSITSPAGGAFPPPPSEAVPNTDVGRPNKPVGNG